MLVFGNKARFSHVDPVLGAPYLVTGIEEGHGELQSKSKVW